MVILVFMVEICGTPGKSPAGFRGLPIEIRYGAP